MHTYTIVIFITPKETWQSIFFRKWPENSVLSRPVFEIPRVVIVTWGWLWVTVSGRKISCVSICEIYVLLNFACGKRWYRDWCKFVRRLDRCIYRESRGQHIPLLWVCLSRMSRDNTGACPSHALRNSAHWQNKHHSSPNRRNFANMHRCLADDNLINVKKQRWWNI